MLAKPEVGDFLSKHFVAAFDRVGTFRVNVGGDGTAANKNGGNVAAFFCTPSGKVIHAVAGPRTAEAFLAEAKWTTMVYREALSDPRTGRRLVASDQVPRMAVAIRHAHAAAAELIAHPTTPAPGRELVLHEPAADPNLAGLERQGLERRRKVHTLLKDIALEPVAQVGPKVYHDILGEELSTKPVELTGATEARQAGAGQTLADFFGDGGTEKRSAAPAAPSPRDPPKPAVKNTSRPARGVSKR